uniref:Uncharacterized protein n=1 Tax=Helianthus annuus TaxID=4232 RepID=A0A251SQD7_HELAN
MHYSLILFSLFFITCFYCFINLLTDNDFFYSGMDRGFLVDMTDPYKSENCLCDIIFLLFKEKVTRKNSAINQL